MVGIQQVILGPRNSGYQFVLVHLKIIIEQIAHLQELTVPIDLAMRWQRVKDDVFALDKIGNYRSQLIPVQIGYIDMHMK
jgi:hypothetical protein